MATVSFDKNIIINEPEAVSELIDALVNDKSRKIDRQLASPTETARGEQKLERYLSHLKN
jgi:hypothetical protein